MTAEAIKSLGAAWGCQGGLLSVKELALLMKLVQNYRPEERISVLEVGHYFGLSTCGLVHALREREQWHLTTVDSHEADPWVPTPAPPHAFEANRARWFDDPNLQCEFIRSQAIIDPPEVDVVFYDGDHREEQVRVLELVRSTKRVGLVVFDDRDFAFPAQCVEKFRGDPLWIDESPEVVRALGDKASPETMTLGVFRRKG
jgi:hypothetical protein